MNVPLLVSKNITATMAANAVPVHFKATHPLSLSLCITLNDIFCPTGRRAFAFRDSGARKFFSAPFSCLFGWLGRINLSRYRAVLSFRRISDGFYRMNLSFPRMNYGFYRMNYGFYRMNLSFLVINWSNYRFNPFLSPFSSIS